MMVEKVAAILTIKDPGDLSASGKRSILAWLRRQERFFARNSHRMSKKQFRARYLYQEEDDAVKTRDK